MNEMTTAETPSAKRIKLSKVETAVKKYQRLLPTSTGFAVCQNLLLAASSTVASSSSSAFVPSSLTASGKTRNDLEKVRSLFNLHGFRTSVVMSPRPALSIYKDSCHISDVADADTTTSRHGKEFLLAMLGMHPDQSDMEHCYAASFKNLYCLLLFGNRIRKLCPKAASEQSIQILLEQNERACCCSIGAAPPSPSVDDEDDGDLSPTSVTMDPDNNGHHSISPSSVPERVARLIKAVVNADHRLRPEQLEHEYDRLMLWNSTYSNATLQLFLEAHDCCIKDVYFKRSPHAPKYERITIYLYDAEIDLLKPPQFTFLPSLTRALQDGPEAVVEDMIQSFWSSLLRHGYFSTATIKAELTPHLEKYFLSGIAHDVNIPLLLNAHFTPKYPLSFYLHGKAGSGKSSLVRHFTPALNHVVETHVDPELLVRFVKQNLNKPERDLNLELELRPNNNDLSVMSIIQGRRMSMTQTKPGLVVIDLEEMASHNVHANPNQLNTAQLISQRFSGRNSHYKEGEHKHNAPRNSTKRGISGDATLITLFTSNYVLEQPCLDALQRLEMFANLKTVEMTAVDGDDRRDFAHSYMKQCIQDRFSSDLALEHVQVELDIPFGSGDTRPLVRHLRMLAFYVCALVADTVRGVGSRCIEANIVQKKDTSCLCTVHAAERSIDLKVGTLENLFPLSPQVFDVRAGKAVEELRSRLLSGRDDSAVDLSELSQIIDFYFAKTLAPAVIVSKDEGLIKHLVEAVGSQNNVHSITDVEAGTYKMMKSLYDPNDTPNLRDDIFKFGKGAFVAVELRCPTTDGQLCIREIIEDSPSMTAFSTNKSALEKSGLFFGVHVVGEITPEVRSRASLIL